MDQAHEPDERLMQQVAQGRAEPLSVLLRRYSTPLLTFLRRMSGDHHRSEELFQETFLAVWAGRKKYQYPRPFRPWLFGIAQNKCRAEYRRAGARPVALDEEAVPTAGGPSPVEAAIATETAALVEKAVLELPAQQRTVVVLRVWNGFSYAEIADALERTESAVRSNMFHGLGTLRKSLAACGLASGSR
jgi:RNA polymerase sigma-70 factor (ECF subfamily)